MANLATLESQQAQLAEAALSGKFGGKESSQHVAWLTNAVRARQEDPFRFLLLLRFSMVNLVGFGLLGVAYFQGLVGQILAVDQTYLSVIIFLVFLVGLVQCGLKVSSISRQLNSVRDFDPLGSSVAAEYLAKIREADTGSRGILANALRLRLSQNIAWIRYLAGSLLLLGLIGTVIGFIIALSGVDPEKASDVGVVGPMISTLISGMSTALYTTLVGSVLNVWLMINYQLLIGGTVKLINAIQEFGELHARG